MITILWLGGSSSALPTTNRQWRGNYFSVGGGNSTFKSKTRFWNAHMFETKGEREREKALAWGSGDAPPRKLKKWP